ncbi:glycoside hydrolase family 18 [Gemmatirosa kalamazoonensis]|uniref:chitinase n=1 Tax=Gemmatirosa kalamazoonensis TaxID=861299 RepID=W0RB18_9BACT|nr:glycosyl hydrolase family 18 protein [Gemmatirosa kalamazoonensis]AHG87657.1 glycoside hydrolase family 18 [Gemmatirosa kalamazoonensis]
MPHRAWAGPARAASALLLLLGALACSPDGGPAVTSPRERASLTQGVAASATPGAAFTWTCTAAGLKPRQCAFDGSTSTASATGVAIVSYTWTWGDGRSETKQVPTTKNTWPSTGVYTVTLTVTDAKGLTGSVSKQVPVGVAAPTNQPPTAAISAPANNATFAQGSTVTFTGAGADPEDGVLSGASLVWTSSRDGQLGTGASLTKTTLTVGAHTITLTATDSKGATATATRSITITAAPPPPPPPSGRWMTGYYAGYQQAEYPVANVDFSYITHLIVAAAQPNFSGGLDTHFYVDPVNGPIMAKALTTRAHAAGRKAIMMIGGDGWHAQLVSATSSANRTKFITNLVAAMNALGFDGVDVDWEPIDAADKPRVLQLLRDIRAAKPNAIITFPVGWLNTNFPGDADPWYAQVAPLVDQMNVMSYEMADNWGGWVSWHSSALFGSAGNRPSSVSSTIAMYHGLGIPLSKLGAGIGAYGSCWQGVSTMLTNIDNTPATVVASDNDMSFTNIMTLYYKASAYRWDATAQVGYLSFSSPTGPDRCTMVSYDDPQSVAAKGAYVKSQGVGGAMMWTINQQYLPNAAAGQRDPLLRAAYTAMQ